MLKTGLDGHRRKHHGMGYTMPQVHKCTRCDSIFSRFGTLKQHELDAHGAGGERPQKKMKVVEKVEMVFPCKVCDKVYKQERGLARHERGHHGRVRATPMLNRVPPAAQQKWFCRMNCGAIL